MMYYGPYSDNLSTFTLLKQIAQIPQNLLLARVKEGVRDARLLLWVAEEMGVSVSWPFVVNCDSKQAISFQEDTCPKSRIRGSFDLREDWVAEVRDQKIVQMSWIHGEKNRSDIMTKCMPTWKFRRMFKLIQDLQSRIFG